MGVKTHMMMIPNTKSSVFPEANFGSPKVNTPKYAVANASNIHTTPNIFLIAFMFFCLKIIYFIYGFVDGMKTNHGFKVPLICPNLNSSD